MRHHSTLYFHTEVIQSMERQTCTPVTSQVGDAEHTGLSVQHSHTWWKIEKLPGSELPKGVLLNQRLC